MDQERRANSMESILVAIGRLEEKTGHIHDVVCDLKERVGVQNGKVGRLQLWQSRIQGILFILMIMVVPIIINFISSWLKFTFHSGG